jgi:hypothetical protein
MQYVYKPLELKTLAVGVAMEHRLDSSEAPDTIKADLERQQQLQGRYRVHHAGRKVEGRDGQALTDEQWILAMDRFDDETEDWRVADIGAWMGAPVILTQSADGRTWTIKDPDFEYDMVLCLGVIEALNEGGEVHNIYFENGALKQDSYRVMDERACEWFGSFKFELTRVDELVYTSKAPRYFDELDMQIVFTETSSGNFGIIE